MQKIKSLIISLVLLTTILSQVTSCGYVLHPERRGQKSGQIDWAIVGLDAIGLIFFVVPGLISFGVDIYSGTIYLTHSTRISSNIEEWEGVQKIKIDPKNINEETIAAAIKENTGISVNFDDPNLKIYRGKELEISSK